jgi:hypothetical protein
MMSGGSYDMRILLRHTQSNTLDKTTDWEEIKER